MSVLVLRKPQSTSIFTKLSMRFGSLFKSIRKQTAVTYFSFFLVSLVLVSIFNKAYLHVTLNSYHSSFFDQLFKYSTFLGDGFMFGVLFLVFLFVKRKVAYSFAIAGVLTLLLIALFKKVIFVGMARPAKYIGLENLHIVDGVKMAFWNTFPSGHTTTAFAIFTILCLYFNKCKTQYIWVSLAIIAGLSRVYLSQHFLIDIFVGSFLGISIGFVSMAFFCKPKRVH